MAPGVGKRCVPVRASNGMWMSVDCGLEVDLPMADCLSAVRGQSADPAQLARALLAKLRVGRDATAPRSWAGWTPATFALAQSRPGAGTARRRPALGGGPDLSRSAFLDSEVKPAAFSRSKPTRSISCAGGVATLDLMLELIARSPGPEVAGQRGGQCPGPYAAVPAQAAPTPRRAGGGTWRAARYPDADRRADGTEPRLSPDALTEMARSELGDLDPQLVGAGIASATFA